LTASSFAFGGIFGKRETEESSKTKAYNLAKWRSYAKRR
jgi:hypothetical protein